jgi:hypothetical protein
LFPRLLKVSVWVEIFDLRSWNLVTLKVLTSQLKPLLYVDMTKLPLILALLKKYIAGN